MIAVLDTNIFVAALLSSTGVPAKICDRWRKRQFEILISLPVLEEYVDIFLYLPVVSKTEAIVLVSELTTFAQKIQISGRLQICKDPDDDKFLETAIAGSADFLVTKNLKHFPSKTYGTVQIVKPSVFLKELEKIFPQ